MTSELMYVDGNEAMLFRLVVGRPETLRHMIFHLLVLVKGQKTEGENKQRRETNCLRTHREAPDNNHSLSHIIIFSVQLLFHFHGSNKGGEKKKVVTTA